MYKFFVTLFFMPLFLKAAGLGIVRDPATEHTALLVPTKGAGGQAVLTLIPLGHDPSVRSAAPLTDIEEATAYAAKFDCTSAEGAKFDYELGFRAYKRWQSYNGSNGQNIRMANENVIPPLYRAYQHEPPHPAAAHLLAQVMHYKSDYMAGLMGAGAMITFPYIVLGTVFVGWWEPRFMPSVYFADREAEYYKVALDKCTDPHLRAEIAPKIKRAEYGVSCAKWTMRAATLGAVVGGAVIGAAAAGAI